jgi:hypothetical protein
MDLKRFERDLDTLSKVDPAGARELRAYLCAYRGDISEARRFFAQAQIGSLTKLRSAVRFLIVLMRVDAHEELEAVFIEQRELIRNDPAAIRTVAQLLVTCGRVPLAEALCAESHRLGVSILVPAPIDRTDTSVNYGGDEAEKAACAIPELHDELTKLELFVKAFGDSHGVEVELADTVALPIDGREVMLCTFSVDRTAEEVGDLEWQLFGALGEELPSVREGTMVLELSSRQ